MPDATVWPFRLVHVGPCILKITNESNRDGFGLAGCIFSSRYSCVSSRQVDLHLNPPIFRKFTADQCFQTLNYEENKS